MYMYMTLCICLSGALRWYSLGLGLVKLVKDEPSVDVLSDCYKHTIVDPCMFELSVTCFIMCTVVSKINSIALSGSVISPVLYSR